MCAGHHLDLREEIKGGWIKVHEEAVFFTKYEWHDQIKED
jgi:hypothetical protein